MWAAETVAEQPELSPGALDPLALQLAAEAAGEPTATMAASIASWSAEEVAATAAAYVGQGWPSDRLAALTLALHAGAMDHEVTGLVATLEDSKVIAPALLSTCRRTAAGDTPRGTLYSLIRVLREIQSHSGGGVASGAA